MLEQWISAIESHAYANPDFLSKFKMREIMNSLRTEYSIRPLELVRKRNNILATERRVVHDAQLEDISVTEEDPRRRDDEHIREKLSRLHMLTQVCTLYTMYQTSKYNAFLGNRRRFTDIAEYTRVLCNQIPRATSIRSRS